MTPKERAAMQQALEALEEYRDTQMIKAPRRAITALREALAGDNMSPTEQADHEPVTERKAQVNELIKESARLIASISDQGDRYLTAVDTLRNAYRLGLKDAASHPVRTKDLTDEEIVDASGIGCALPNEIDRFRAVIVADREKNK